MDMVTLVQGSKYIKVIVYEDTVTTKWGKIGGKEQRTSHTYGYINKGKANELSPVEAATADYRRKIEKKIREGYVEVADTTETIEVDTELDFDNPQSSFTLSKPVTKISDKKLQNMLDKGKAILTEKENGMCHWVIFNSKGTVSIFTRRMNDHTRKYPKLKEAFERYGLFNTVLAVELVVENPDHHLGFRLLQEISKSNTLKGKLKKDQSKSLALQDKNRVRACVFYMLYLNGDPIWEESSATVVNEILKVLFQHKGFRHLIYRSVERSFDKVSDIKDFLYKHEKDLEGLVCWDRDKKVEVTFNGKPRRRAAYKVKVPKEMDVIAWGYTEGTGDHQGKIGALRIYKFKPTRTGKIIESNLLDYGKVGSGLSDELCDPELWTFPCVIEIEYEYHEPTGKFKFPRFTKVHEDKYIWECTAEDGEAPDAKPADIEELKKWKSFRC